MTTLSLLLAGIALASRLPLLVLQGPVSRKQVLSCIAFQVSLSLLAMVGLACRPAACLGLAGAHMLLGWVWLHLEQRLGPEPGHSSGSTMEVLIRLLEIRRLQVRLGTSLLLVLLATWAGSAWAGAQGRPLWIRISDGAPWFSPLGSLLEVHWRPILLCALGLLLCVQEASLCVRLALLHLDVAPLGSSVPDAPGAAPARACESQERLRGRWIGILERMIIFTVILAGQYGALGFVLAAKAMARFKSLDERPFAEYFILGTLLSVVLGGAVALAVRRACGLG